ncbi:MAG TPA: signal peptidase I [Polyangiales bacterium]|jgi:signal peptidase I|nr:signal peptidase I [Polyangiales bacterium]
MKPSDKPASEAPIPLAPSQTAEPPQDSLLSHLRTIASAVFLALCIRTCVAEPFEIEGPSMEPTLLSGDRVVVEKFRFGLFLPLREHAELSWSNPRPGDVVVLRSPADGVDIIKRVIGVPGDQIELRDEDVYRNGKVVETKQVGKCEFGTGALQPGCRVYESQVNTHSFRFSTAFRMFEPFSARVPEGHIYVLGDHRDHSNDSRNPAIGMVPVSAVKGRALMIYWSSGEQGTRFDRAFHQVQ